MTQSTIDPKLLQRAAKTLKTIAHPVRLRIIEQLRARDCAVGELVTAIGAPQAIISKHLALLKGAGIVTSRIDFNFRYYSLANTKVLDVLHCIKKSCPKEV